MNKVANRYPQTIAAEINSLKEHTKSVVLMASVEIGRRLIEAKEMLPHGEWSGWLENNVDYSTSTANNLMQIYNEYGDDPQSLGGLSYTKAVALIGIEKEERQRFVEEHDVEGMSSRELQKVIKEKKELEKKRKAEAERAAAAEKEKESLNKKIEDLESQLIFMGGDNSAEIELIESELAHEREKIKQLEEDLRRKPIEAMTVEVMPPEAEKELNELRERLSGAVDPSELEFKVHFDGLVGGFQKVLKSLGEIHDIDVKKKYRNAVSKLIAKMEESLPKTSDLEAEKLEENQVTIFDALDEGT